MNKEKPTTRPLAEAEQELVFLTSAEKHALAAAEAAEAAARGDASASPTKTPAVLPGVWRVLKDAAGGRPAQRSGAHVTLDDISR